MFSKQKDKDQKNGMAVISSVIAEDITINGKLTGESGLRIEGKFEGELDVKGLLVIGENAVVTSEKIFAAVALVNGQVHGAIHAKKVEIRETGKVWGDIEAESFTIDEGAFLHGKVNMKEAEPAEEE